jgi:hypothetical protein
MLEIKDKVKLSDQQGNFTWEQLVEANNASVDHVLTLIRDLPDSYVTFQPVDEDAYDPYSADRSDKYDAWTLGHVVVHITASAEEAAARASMLARGVTIEQRMRYETPWESVTTIQELVDRLEESRKIRNAYYQAWPNKPQLEVTYDEYEKHFGKVNAIGIGLLGLKHDYDHYGQLEDIIGQARAAEGVSTD